MAEAPSILLVEDEALIAADLEDALRDAGFEVAVVSSGEEAAALLNSETSSFAALATDVDLSGRMKGWQVAKIARQVAATFPVVYMTGSNERQWSIEGVPNSILLTKPFAPAQLVTAISQLLNKDAPGP